MTELIKDKLYAIVVPEKSVHHYIGICNYKIIGTVTKDTIDFDCEKYLEQEEGLFKNYDALPVDWFDYFKSPNASMRSLIKSKGLHFYNPYGEENNLIQKLLIIEKL